MSGFDRVHSLHISPLGWVAIAVAFLGPWLVVILLLTRQPPASPVGHVKANPASRINGHENRVSGSALVRGPVGPWGQLEYIQIEIEPPEAFIPTQFTTAQPSRWVFPAAWETKLETLWQRAGLTTKQTQLLSSPAWRAGRGTDGSLIVIHPDRDFLLGLSAAARAIIYTALAEFPENMPQRDPFRFPVGTAASWLRDSEISEDIIALTTRLLYRRGSSDCLSDYDIVLMQISPDVRSGYLKTLSRKSSLLVSLRVPHGADADALARYWGAGRRSKDLAPLLQSLARRPSGGSLDIVHLLPPFARRLVYTYPLPTDNPAASARDCHWTSFNFHRDPPDERLGTLEFVRQTLDSDYYPAGGQPTFGDVIMLIQDGNQVVHSCVFLADDLVFTKNGAAFSVPWNVVRLEQVRAFYSLGETPLEFRRYRLKDR